MLTLLGEVSKSSTIPPIDTGSALTLKPIWICASAMTIMGSQEALLTEGNSDERFDFSAMILFLRYPRF